MGRLIDADYVDERIEDELAIGADRQEWYERIIDNAPTVEAIPKADYESRLKAGMVAMLEEISFKFDEQYYANRHELHDDSLNRGLEQGQSIIQQKINELKAESEDKV